MKQLTLALFTLLSAPLLYCGNPMCTEGLYRRPVKKEHKPLPFATVINLQEGHVQLYATNDASTDPQTRAAQEQQAKDQATRTIIAMHKALENK